MEYNYDYNEYSSLYYGIVKTKNYVIASISKPITIRPNNTIYFDDIEIKIILRKEYIQCRHHFC